MKKIITIFLLLCSLNVFSQITYYVSPNGDDRAGGTTWGTALRTVQKALEKAVSGNQIWVIAGTYYPDEKDGASSNSREASFVLKSGVKIYGGFPVTVNPTLSQRNPATNLTILSGEIQGNSDYGDNAYHVVVASGVDASALLDGFIITGGNANGSSDQEQRGGGLYNISSFLTVTGCTFSGNAASISGGAIYDYESSPTLNNCSFLSNMAATNGGGIFNVNSSPVLTRCTFSGNDAFEGGGMFNEAGSPWLNKCSFSGNNAHKGGGLYNNTAAPTLTGCTFSQNTAFEGGGVYNNSSTPSITDCDFSDNSVTASGGGIYNLLSAPVLTHCTFSRNTSVSDGGGVLNAGSSPSLTWCSFSENTAGTTGGAMTNTETSSQYSSPTLTWCSFSQNSATFSGGAIYNDNHSVASLADCRFWKNSAVDGGGITNVGNSTLSLVNCSMAGNTANYLGGGLYNHYDASATLTNCIVWGNTASTEESNIVDDETSASTVTHSLVPGYSSDGNKEGDPKFADLAGGDLHLQDGSPAINAGYNTALPPAVTMDLDGFARIYNATVDMGAYEYMPCPTAILYVNRDASGLNDGTSWANAFTRLQDALARSSFCSGITQIWVAAGVYYPDEGAGHTDNNRSESFFLKNGLTLYGGFPATGNPAFGDRAPATNATILSGDLQQNDAPAFGNNGENAYHVVQAIEVDHTAVLDGFTIRGGNANGDENKQGGGMYTYSASPTILQCIFSENSAATFGGGLTNASIESAVSAPTITNCSFISNKADNGGGMDNYYSSPVVTNCTFTQNTTTTGGGGLYNNYASPTVTNCTFTGNKADDYGGGIANANGSNATITGSSFTGNSSADGGGIENYKSPTVTISGCTFTGNKGSRGGGLFNNDHSAPTVTDCIFSANEATSFGGGIYNALSSSPELTGCSFTKNKAPSGGGVYNTSSAPTVTNCTFEENTATSFGGGMYNAASSASTLSDCSFTKNTALTGGGLYNSSSSPTVTDCIFTGNEAETGGGLANWTQSAPAVTTCTFTGNTARDGGGLFNSGNSAPTITGCTFEENTATSYGGGMYNTVGSSPTISGCSFIKNTAPNAAGMENYRSSSPLITACRFIQNAATNCGGAMGNARTSSPTLVNCSFFGNTAVDSAGAIRNDESSPLMINCTFAANSATYGGAIANDNNSSPAITNCILWGDTGGEISNNNSTPTVTYSIVEGGYTGNGNIDANPLFASATTGDLHLLACSPAINTGIEGVNTTDKDLDGSARIFDGLTDIIDRGAYEYGADPVGTTLYVNAAAVAGANNGSSWANAFTRLQDALAQTGTCTNVTQIWVAAGTYYPDEGAGHTDNSRTETFALKNGLILYGGFPATGNPAFEDRAPATHATILSGEIQDNANNSDNAFHVVKAEGVDNTAVLDGFTITDGNSNSSYPNDRGGGMFIASFAAPTLTACRFTANTAISGGAMHLASSASPVLTGCSFASNTATLLGGAVYSTYASATLTKCIFTQNTAMQGAGIYEDQASMTLEECTFTQNTATSLGGGIHSNKSKGAILKTCTFTGNTASGGGGMAITDAAKPILLEDCLFSGNSATYGGGGLSNAGQSSTPEESYPSVALKNCTFTGNTSERGGATSQAYVKLTLTTCTFEDNTATTNGGALYGDHTLTTLTTCSFSGNKASGMGGALYHNGVQSTIADGIFTNNTATTLGGAIYNAGGTATLTGCEFTGNKASQNGGGMYNRGTLTLTSCQFSGNTATQKGGALYSQQSAPALTGCTFSSNAAAEGGALYNFYDTYGVSYKLINCRFWKNTATTRGGAIVNYYNASPAVTNCTFVANSAPTTGGIHNIVSFPVITNSILWGNTANQIVPATLTTVTYSIVQGGYSGTGNKNIDPLFADATTGDLHLKACSPAINAGNNDDLPEGITTDLEGKPRIVHTTVDMGAYEFQDAIDNTPPVITLGSNPVSPATLAPPNHKMRDITVNYTVSDGCTPSDLITTALTVSSSEDENGTGDGDTSPDWIVDPKDPLHLQLRAERAAQGDGRVYTITITATDTRGNSSQQTVKVYVSHNITAPQSGASFKVGSTVALAGTFWDKPGNRHTAKWLIDENTTAKGVVTEPSGAKNGRVTGSYRFNTAGVYKLQMNVTDQYGVTTYANTAGDLDAIVVIYDPNGGYTYGGGHFASPAGALTSNPTATGKVSYGFAVNYFKGATYPKGETQFEFKVGEFEYNALNFEYLAIDGARAQFRGTGKIIGGQSGIDFILTAVDGALDGSGVDKVRIRIFNKNTGYVYYDNEPTLGEAANPTTKVGVNSTVVIKGAVQKGMVTSGEEGQAETTGLQLQVLPNPTHGDFQVFVASDNQRDRITLQVFDQWGRIIGQQTVSGPVTRIGADYRPGTYYIRVVQGDNHREAKVIRLPY